MKPALPFFVVAGRSESKEMINLYPGSYGEDGEKAFSLEGNGRHLNMVDRHPLKIVIVHVLVS